MARKYLERMYDRRDSIVFRKTKELFGGLSNMASGYPLLINDTKILTSEALYQACRFPHMPDIQIKIINEKSPMTAKMVSKPYRKESRADWDTIKVKIMRWCIRVKLAQNMEQFGDLLLSTGNYPIVEESAKDSFWGAKPIDNYKLIGVNALGRLLMEVRREYNMLLTDKSYALKPPQIENLLLLGEPIKSIYFTKQDIIKKEIYGFNIIQQDISEQLSIF